MKHRSLPHSYASKLLTEDKVKGKKKKMKKERFYYDRDSIL